jgi:hypothetical protein
MAKPITAIRIRKDRAELLREKAMELTVQKKEYVKEADLVNFLIDEFINRINIDRDGLFIEEEKED